MMQTEELSCCIYYQGQAGEKRAGSKRRRVFLLSFTNSGDAFHLVSCFPSIWRKNFYSSDFGPGIAAVAVFVYLFIYSILPMTDPFRSSTAIHCYVPTVSATNHRPPLYLGNQSKTHNVFSRYSNTGIGHGNYPASLLDSFSYPLSLVPNKPPLYS